MISSGESPQAQVRILGVVAAAELSVGGFAADALPGRIAVLCGVDAAAGARGVASGRSLLDSMGLGALVIDPGLAGEIVGMLGSRGPGAAADWACSLEERGGGTPGTRLAMLVAAIRAVEPAGAMDVARAQQTPPAVKARPSPTTAAGSKSDASPRAHPATQPDDLLPVDDSMSSDVLLETEVLELTFDDEPAVAGTDDLFGEVITDDLGLDGAIDLDDDLPGGAAKGR